MRVHGGRHVPVRAAAFVLSPAPPTPLQDVRAGGGRKKVAQQPAVSWWESDRLDTRALRLS